MGVEEAAVNSIMSGIENTGGVKQHNHKKKLRQRFDIIKKLGQGTFGKVQLGINKETGQEVAIKTIKKSKIESDADLIRIRREIQIMSSVQHPNIIHIYEVFENREKMVLVMEYAAGGELYDYLSERKVLPEDEARRIFRQIATACYYCHKHKICHRDLKLENILLDENNNAKIADFGLSNVFDDQRLLNTFCGSPLYASPEIVKGTPYHGPEVDCWSLGVLLYTLVYGAMPFDGSNFKRLVKQISQGDYYEPSKPSPASPLIRDMLTVNPKKRADIEKICSHWWVNETYNLNCLEVSEELANQTPVRLDVLLSLAPPAPQLESEKLVVTEDVTEEGKSDSGAPVRSQSVGSLMDLTTPERRIMNMINDEKFAPKRKLESTVSTDRLNSTDKRKEKIIKENTVADITVHGTIQEDQMNEAAPLVKSLTQTITKPMEVEPEGAACQELLQEAKRSASQSKLKRNQSSVGSKILEGINEIPSQENLTDKENKTQVECKEEPVKKEEKPAKKKPPKKKVLGDKNENDKGDEPVAEKPESTVSQVKENGVQEKPGTKKVEEGTTKAPTERRKSRIFEAAEKFQNLISPTETKPAPMEKPKKILLPDSMVTQQGVSVDGFKKEFERKSSLTSSTPVKPKISSVPKRTLIDKQKSEEEKTSDGAATPQEIKPKVTTKLSNNEAKDPEEEGEQRPEKVKNAVNIISNALDKEGTRKSKSRPTMMRKPPVPFGASGRSASGNIGTIAPLSPPIQTMGPKPFVRPCYENKVAVAEVKQVVDTPTVTPDETQTSNAEITLKSATLPRRKTTKAQIQLNFPTPKPAQMEFRTEAAHNVEAATPPPQVRSEVVVPVGSPTSDGRGNDDRSSKERIIPIAMEKKTENGKPDVQSPPSKPPVARPFQTQKSNISQGSNSLSRQSTQDSDSETTSTGEPIKKSAREYIIPIAVEGGGYVTPRAGSVEPSESNASTMTNRSKSKFGRGARRLNSLLSDRDSEDESPFASLHRHSSFGKDSDNEDSNKGNFHHMHRLRRIRPKKAALEHNDSVSSGEEDDDDGFEILTAENLFSTLLSRVRDLTQKLNVDEGVRPGFPSSRLLSQFDRGTNFWNRLDSPLSRHSSLGRTFGIPSSSQSNFNVPWRRSASKDLASDIETVFNDQNSGTLTARIPRGDAENLNLAELDLKKLNLSEEDRLALSALTPGLSRRIEKQLLAQLTPAEVRKLQRTLSAKSSEEKPRRSPAGVSKSFLPQPSDFSVRSSSSGAQPRSIKPPSSSRIGRILSPESSVSDTSRKDSSTSEPLEKRTSVRRISRFLRPDFYEPERENGYIKEKKERERETQQVLKEIRDKRKSRLRSLSRSRGEEKKEEATLDAPTEVIHDYVNVKTPKISKLVRPKSYPSEQTPPPDTTKAKKTTKKTKEDKNEANKQLNKNKLLQTLEKKLEKFRGKEVEESKKSVVDSAIKRLREQSLPRNPPPCTEGGLIKRAVSVEDLPGGAKPLPASRKSVTKILGLFNKKSEKSPEKTVKKERPKSLLLTKETPKSSTTPEVSAKSKLPVISFRRSLNLDSKPDTAKDNLHLDLPSIELESPGPSGTNTEHRNSLATTDDSSTLLSPTDDYLSCDSWSVCSDFHHLNDLHSPQSHNGHLYSGDEGESVIDRIRRKSFYTRFNEKKRTRKPSLTYKSDLYRSDFGGRELNKPDYNSLDRYRSPSVTRRTSFTSYLPEAGTSTRSSSTKEYRPYTRSASAMLNDYVNVPGGSQTLSHTYQNVPGSHHNLIGSYQNIPGSYQTYSSRIARPAKGLYTDPEDLSLSRRPYTSHRSISPASEYYTDRTPSSSSFLLQSPTSSEPI